MSYSESNSIIRFYFSGSRCLSNVFWTLVVGLGGLSFFVTGLSSFFEVNLLPFSDYNKLSFIPQGLVLIFYGTLGLILGIFLSLNVLWDVGSGYNEYNKDLQKIQLYRKTFPGKNQKLSFIFSFAEIRSIKMKLKEGINPKRQLVLCLIDNREVPLTRTDQFVALNKLEENAMQIAKCLNIYLETE